MARDLEKAKEWRAANNEREKDLERLRRKNNPEAYKASQKRYYLAHPDRIKAKSKRRYKDPKSKASTLAWRTANREKLLNQKAAWQAARKEFVAWLKDVPCLDCGRRFPPCAMDFDHRPGTTKEGSIAAMYSSSAEKYMAEVVKCDLVCACCHRVRTHSRYPFLRQRKMQAA